MILHLYIKDFVLIDELSLDFRKGFSVFVGETGAGKSILIDAISLLFKDRASASFIAKGKEKAIIEATFDLSHNEKALYCLKEAGFDTEGEVTFTREINATGKNTVRIDHRIATISLMKECLQNEIDIHNQRDNQYLLNAGTHIDLLDEYLKNSELREKTAAAYRDYCGLLEEKEQVLSQVYNENDLEYFRFQLNEIEEADLKVGEDEELEAQEKQYKAVRSSFESIQRISEAYDSISDTLYDMEHQVNSLDDNEMFESIRTGFNDGYYAIEDAVERLRQALDDNGFDEEDFNQLQERLFLLQRLKRKYGGSIEDILLQKEELEKKITAFDHRKEYLEDIELRIDTSFRRFNDLADKLSSERKKGCQSLEKDIQKHLKDLVLPNARFVTRIEATKPNAKGIDHVEFYISMNKGEDPKPLVKVASGGELSRLMLGLKTIFTKLEKIETVIFDEIDTGVSGSVASAIGKKMLVLGDDCQVFAVTHLAPVAASADYYYLVEKGTVKDKTTTKVIELDREKMIRQVALIANGELTDASIEAASELMERNGKHHG